MRLGFQIPNFNFPDVDDTALFEHIASMAVTAEDSGFDTVFVMDHLYQLPLLGPPDNYMIEAYTLLGGLAARTKTARLGTLVTGNTYRNPTLLAKIITALDVVSSGRALLGIGSGWFELEHDQLGFEFGTFTDRFEKLEEALQIILPMLADERPTFDGKHYSVTTAINQPSPVQAGGIPVMIGGGGEKKTLRMVAQYATLSNLPVGLDEVPRKLEALDAHCAALGRDRSEISVSVLLFGMIAGTHDEAVAARDAYLGGMGMTWDALDDATRASLDARMLVGGPDEVTEKVQYALGLGLDGITLNLPATGHDLDAIATAGEVITKAMG
jgi:F420-dependent oxidoreductase-like protein